MIIGFLEDLTEQFVVSVIFANVFVQGIVFRHVNEKVRALL